MTSDRIHSVWDFWDVPRQGIADSNSNTLFRCINLRSCS
jgi:hypothetical protein